MCATNHDHQALPDKAVKTLYIQLDALHRATSSSAINQYTAGRFDGVTMTNMDMLTIPSAARVDTTALITGDFSNGNDAVVLKGRDSLEDIAGLDVYLLELPYPTTPWQKGQ